MGTEEEVMHCPCCESVMELATELAGERLAVQERWQRVRGWVKEHATVTGTLWAGRTKDGEDIWVPQLTFGPEGYDLESLLDIADPHWRHVFDDD